MEPECSLPHLQVSTTCPCAKPDQSSQCPPIHFQKIHLNIIIPLRLVLSRGLFPSGFPTRTLSTPLLSLIRATCHAHLILLDLITRTKFCEDHRSPSSSLRTFLQSRVTSSLLGPNNLLSALLPNTLSLRSSEI